MGIRLAVTTRVAAGLVVAGVGGMASGPALAQANLLKECGTQYQAAKAANELGGQGWQDFLKACRARLKEAATAAEAKPAEAAKPAAEAKPVEAPAATPAPAAATPTTNPLKPATTEAAAPAKDSRQAMQARQKKCAAEWKANKKDLLKENAKLTWPKYWSACNKKLKDAGE